MWRNNESFASLPDVVVSRSRFDRDSELHTTLSSGRLYPIYLDEILPGDTFDMTCASTVRMSTPIVPVMDNCYIDTYFFFVPARLCWNRWREFCGELPRSDWDEIVDDIKLPKIAFSKDCEWFWDSDVGVYRRPDQLDITDPNYNVNFKNLEGTLVDYFGLPFLNMRDKRGTGNNPKLTDTFNMLPFEAYNLIWNEFFRDQNVMDKCPLKLQFTSNDDGMAGLGIYYETKNTLYDSSFDDDYYFGDNRLNDIIHDYLTVKPVSKFHDYFTSCLPQPQKHAPIAIPGFDNLIPVMAGYNEHDPSLLENYSSDTMTLFDMQGLDYVRDGNVVAKGGSMALEETTVSGSPGDIVPSNLYAYPNINAPNINDLRYAFALQNLFERDARGGTRYISLLHTHFGVTSPDARLQRPEYLGGDRIPVNMDQVVQTSETSSTSPQGNVSGLSLTNNIGTSFTKSFTEHGYILGLVCIRPQHSYQNGINRMWSRSNRFDFYYPSLANIGEQPVFLSELLAGQHSDPQQDVPTVFGYQEPWAEYRYKPNSCTGKMRSLLPDSLDIWHYADIFNNDNTEDQDLFTVPNLSTSFIAENPFNIDRSLAISSNYQPQFFGDFYFKCACTRPMPLYSIPGLVDHH